MNRLQFWRRRGREVRCITYRIFRVRGNRHRGLVSQNCPLGLESGNLGFQVDFYGGDPFDLLKRVGDFRGAPAAGHSINFKGGFHAAKFAVWQ